jgi:hypothetical protein
MSLLAVVPLVSKALDLIFPDPKVAMEHKIAVLKLDQEGAFKQLDADVSLALAQIAVNKEEAASTSLFKSGWRPAVGWVCVLGLAYQFVFRPLVGWAAQLYLGATIPLPPMLDMETLMTLLAGMLGLGSMRTWEKLAGKA